MAIPTGEQMRRAFFLLAKVKLSIISDKQETKLKRQGEQGLQSQKQLVLTHKIGKQEAARRKKKPLEAEMSQTAENCLTDFNKKAKFFGGATGIGRSYVMEKFGLKEKCLLGEVVVGMT